MFKVGDRVRTITDYGPKRGSSGTIVIISSAESIGIEFDEKFEGHNLDNRCKDGHGWWLNNYDIERLFPLSPFEAEVQDYINKELHR